MNRWWGNKDDSLAQAADRSARAARRTIAAQPQLILSSDDEAQEFADAETSFKLPQLDGDDDDVGSAAGSVAGSDIATMAQPKLITVRIWFYSRDINLSSNGETGSVKVPKFELV